ncbi:MAG: PVC-type heme-binding CxxCH protein [Opitutaceae bacterium]
MRPPPPPPVLRRFTALLATGVSFVAAAETASFAVGGQTLTVPAGFTVERVAGPPVVNRPISLAFDPAGALYATDSSGLSERAPKQFEEKPHRIVRLVDADGDGRFEGATVFADRVMFPQGALFHEGSLYVAAPPHLWKFTDADGDGVAERREVWWDGGTLTGCANDVHGPYLGPDGWFYWTKGAFAEQRHTLGDGRPFVTRAAHIFRARPDGRGFEPVMTGGMDNPVGVTFGPGGERFLSGTFFQLPAAGKRDGLIHALHGGVYGKENAASAGHPRTGDLLPIMTHMGAAAPCGSATLRGNALGAGFEGNLLVCYFNLRRVVRHELIPDGATFRTRETDFLTSDQPDFRPTDVLEDADGSVLVVDTGGWYKICCPTSQLAKPDVLGGIYRIRRTGATPAADPRGRQIPWARLDAAGLTRLLGDARPDVVEQAQARLGRLGEAAVPTLRAAATGAREARIRINALWALARIEGDAARAATRETLRDPGADVLRVALHGVSLWRDAAAFTQLLPLLQHADAMVVRAAAEALGRTGRSEAVAPLLAAAGKLPAGPATAAGSPAEAAARTLDHSFIHALIELGHAGPLLSFLQTTAPPAALRAALVAADQLTGSPLQPGDVLPWLRSGTAPLPQTAGWIIAQRPAWGDTLGTYFRERLQTPPSDAAERAALHAQLLSLAASTGVQQALAGALGDAPPAGRALAAEILARASLREAPALWLEALARRLPEATDAERSALVSAARAQRLPKGGHAGLIAALGRIGADARLPAPLRLEALAAAAAHAGTPEPAILDFLLGQLAANQPLAIRQTAAETLARSRLIPAQQLRLADALATAGAMEIPRLLPAFERAPGNELGRRLLAGLAASPARASLRPGQLRPVLAKYPPEIRREADALLASLEADTARQNARVEAVAAGLAQGDLRRGQALFNSPRTACVLCHKIGYGGGLLGPDLTAIGKIRSERELLEAVMYPSAAIVRGYETVVATTRAGENHSGILKLESADELVLATGPDSEVRLARAQVTDLQPGAVSAMPPGMDVVLSPQELVDLVAFLKSRL